MLADSNSAKQLMSFKAQVMSCFSRAEAAMYIAMGLQQTVQPMILSELYQTLDVLVACQRSEITSVPVLEKSIVLNTDLGDDEHFDIMPFINPVSVCLKLKANAINLTVSKPQKESRAVQTSHHGGIMTLIETNDSRSAQVLPGLNLPVLVSTQTQTILSQEQENSELEAKIKAMLKIPRRGIVPDDFSTFLQKKFDLIDRLKLQVCDAQERGAKSEQRRLKNKIASYRSRIKARLHLQRYEIQAIKSGGSQVKTEN